MRSTTAAGTATWYRRAYYDDGTPLGSSHNSECRIDVLAQAWAVISRAAPADRAAQAMEAVDDHSSSTARPGSSICSAPPFDRDAHDPGYIKGYRAGHPREWRPVHARRHVGAARLRRARPPRPRRRATWRC